MLMLSLFLPACGGTTMDLHEDANFTATYEFIGNDSNGYTSRPIKITHDDLRQLEQLKLCGTGATTVTDSITIKYENGVTKGFGFANFGTNETPFLHVSHKFNPEDAGQDLRSPCTGKDKEKLHKFVFSKTGYVSYE